VYQRLLTNTKDLRLNQSIGRSEVTELSSQAAVSSKIK
jgi:hypothetical protein